MTFPLDVSAVTSFYKGIALTLPRLTCRIMPHKKSPAEPARLQQDVESVPC